VEDKEVLQHLLKVEAEAASLADDAAKEADKRIADAKKQVRARYDETYTREAAALEEKYKADIRAVQVAYQKELDDFQKGLDSMKPDAGTFSKLLEQLLFEERP
jgi:membrane protein involved in colicin uptake